MSIKYGEMALIWVLVEFGQLTEHWAYTRVKFKFGNLQEICQVKNLTKVSHYSGCVMGPCLNLVLPSLCVITIVLILAAEGLSFFFIPSILCRSIALSQEGQIMILS